MTTDLFTGSAKIYQFPVRPRVRSALTRNGSRLAEVAAPSICAEAFGSWYHEEAIHEASHDAKPPREH
ncbi:hypothetical protein BH11PSE4_BH11PSE4_37270 [soil metagenome]